MCDFVNRQPTPPIQIIISFDAEVNIPIYRCSSSSSNPKAISNSNCTTMSHVMYVRFYKEALGMDVIRKVGESEYIVRDV